MKGKRLDKVNSLIQEELSRAINQTMGEGFGAISVNFVLTSRDLSISMVYVSSLNHSEKLLTVLEKNRREINERFIKRVQLKKTPKLQFLLDTKQDKINRVEELLTNIGENK